MPFLIRNGRIVRWLNYKAENGVDIWFEQYGNKEPIILTKPSFNKSWTIEAATPDEDLTQFISDMSVIKPKTLEIFDDDE